MPTRNSRMPISDAARDCCSGLLAFVGDVNPVLENMGIPPTRHRIAICILAWAMCSAIVRAAGFTVAESERLKALVESELGCKWTDEGIDVELVKEPFSGSGSAYCRATGQWSHVQTAAAFCEIFVASLQVEPSLAASALQRLTPICAHRLILEIHRFSDLRSRQAIQWTVVATVITFCQLSMMSPNAASIDADTVAEPSVAPTRSV